MRDKGCEERSSHVRTWNETSTARNARVEICWTPSIHADHQSNDLAYDPITETTISSALAVTENKSISTIERAQKRQGVVKKSVFIAKVWQDDSRRRSEGCGSRGANKKEVRRVQN